MTSKVPAAINADWQSEQEFSEELEEAVLSEEDNLRLIEWIWPAIEKLLYKYGVRTYSDMVEEWAEGLEEILINGWKKYAVHDPATWPDQAKLAGSGKWSELEEYQEILKWWKK